MKQVKSFLKIFSLGLLLVGGDSHAVGSAAALYI